MSKASEQGTTALGGHLWYFAQAHCHFPSTFANNVQVMKACSGFASAGQPATLVVPSRLRTARQLAATGRDFWTMYAVARNFEIKWCRFPYPFYRLQQSLYAMVAGSYAVHQRARFVYTRSEWLGLLLSKLGMLTTVEMHDYVPNLPLRLLRNEAKRGRLLAIVSISRALAEKLIEFGFPAEVTVVAHDAVDLERFSTPLSRDAARAALGLDETRPIACYVGSLRHDRRGLETLIDTAALMPDIQFLVVGGDSGDLDVYKPIINARNLNNVEFVGHVLNRETPKYLYAADVLLMPYTTDTPHHKWFSPMKMFEYLAAGRPIVASDFPVLREVLTDQENALFVAPGNAGALAQAITRAIVDKSLASRLSANSVQTAERYTWTARQEKILAFMKRRLEQKS